MGYPRTRMTPHAVAGSLPTVSRVATATRFTRVRRPARPVAPPRTRLTHIRPLVGPQPVGQLGDAELDQDLGALLADLGRRGEVGGVGKLALVPRPSGPARRGSRGYGRRARCGGSHRWRRRARCASPPATVRTGAKGMSAASRSVIHSSRRAGGDPLGDRAPLAVEVGALAELHPGEPPLAALAHLGGQRRRGRRSAPRTCARPGPAAGCGRRRSVERVARAEVAVVDPLFTGVGEHRQVAPAPPQRGVPERDADVLGALEAVVAAVNRAEQAECGEEAAERGAGGAPAGAGLRLGLSLDRRGRDRRGRRSSGRGRCARPRARYRRSRRSSSRRSAGWPAASSRSPSRAGGRPRAGCRRSPRRPSGRRRRSASARPPSGGRRRCCGRRCSAPGASGRPRRRPRTRRGCRRRVRGFSTLITVAPISASRWLAIGPERWVEKSTMRRLDSATGKMRLIILIRRDRMTR